MARFISRGGCLPYNPKLNDRSRELRNRMTKAERKIWYDYLRYHRYTFQRQKTILNYIVDFYCSTLKLVIEIDGDVHSGTDAKEYDQNRTDILNGYDLKVLRFKNEEVIYMFDEVCMRIQSVIQDRIAELGSQETSQL